MLSQRALSSLSCLVRQAESVSCMVGGLTLPPSAGLSLGIAAAEGPSTSYTLVAQRWATKKAGGNANQGGGSKPKNLGVKLTDGELAFPGMIIARQRGTRFHPGYNVGLGKDHTIFATAPGFVRFNCETTPYGKERRVISVEPVNGDWTQDYTPVAERLVARRAQIKRSKLTNVPLEPALHFPLNAKVVGTGNTKLTSWRSGGDVRWPTSGALLHGQKLQQRQQLRQGSVGDI